MPEEYLFLTPIGVLFLLFIREFFVYLKSKKNGNHSDIDQKIFAELKLMNENHLSTICREISKGNQEVVKAITDMNLNIGNKLDNVSDGISRLLGRTDK